MVPVSGQLAPQLWAPDDAIVRIGTHDRGKLFTASAREPKVMRMGWSPAIPLKSARPMT